MTLFALPPHLPAQLRPPVVFPEPAPIELAQAILPNGAGTTLETQGNQLNISGGTQAGSNLFHSFERFNLNASQTANFIAHPTIENILGRSIDSIAKRGFSDTTLKHVTERAKLSHGVVNFHFDSKEALYDATLGFLAEEHYAAWIAYYGKAKPTPAHQLAAIISADFDRKICTHKRLAVWFAFWGQAKYRPNYLKIHNTYDNERYDRIVSLCAALIDEGDYTDLDVARTARLIESISDGTWLSLMLYPELNDREACRADCMMGLSKIFPKHFPLDP